MLSTIDKLADSLAAANRQALTPIGKSCKTISVLDDKKNSDLVKIDGTLKREIESRQDSVISSEEKFTGQISELDLMTGACKISLVGGEDERINGVITDPALMMPDNAYVEAFSKRADITFRAKTQKSRDGDIMKFFISDTVSGN